MVFEKSTCNGTELLGWRRLSELKLKNPGSIRVPSLYTARPGEPQKEMGGEDKPLLDFSSK